MPTQEFIVELVAEELAAGRLVLPTLPEIALAISQLLARDDVSTARVAQEISKDPATAARVLATANTAGMRGAGKSVDTLNQAVTRLGFELTRVLVNRIAMEQMFHAKSAALNQILKNTWLRSLQAAAMGSVLARKLPHLNTETAMLSGLVHLVGVLPIIRLLDAHHRDEYEALHTEQSVFRYQSEVGRMVLEKWKLPPDLVAVPMAVGDFSRTHEGPADYADLMNLTVLVLKHLPAPQNDEELPVLRKLSTSMDLQALQTPELQQAYEQALKLLS